MSQALRKQVIAEAMTWLDTPYHHQADIKGAGCDCIFLIVRAYHACGLIPDVDPRPYPADYMLHGNADRYLDGVLQFAHQVDKPQPGDVVLFRFGRVTGHGALVLDWPRIVHAYLPMGKVVITDVSLRDDLQKRVSGFYSLFEDDLP